MVEKHCMDDCKYCQEIDRNVHGASHFHGSGIKLICTHPDLEVDSKVIVDDLYEYLGYGKRKPTWCPGYEEDSKDYGISLKDVLGVKDG